jgi:deoxyribose-phosphate aldolase
MTIPPDAAEWDLASCIDHTLLLTQATLEQVDHWCEAADRYHFPTVCVHPSQVKRAVERVHGSKVKVSTVVGFPNGTNLTEVKRLEAEMAVDQGASELDVRINLGWLKEDNLEAIHSEMAQLVEATAVPIWAILETTLLTEAEKRAASEVCIDAGVAGFMTCTGWAGGATLEDVRLLWQLTQGRIAVKASGGIHTVEWAISLLQAGATRLGTSYGVQLMQQLHSSEAVSHE